MNCRHVLRHSHQILLHLHHTYIYLLQLNYTYTYIYIRIYIQILLQYVALVGQIYSAVSVIWCSRKNFYIPIFTVESIVDFLFYFIFLLLLLLLLLFYQLYSPCFVIIIKGNSCLFTVHLVSNNYIRPRL